MVIAKKKDSMLGNENREVKVPWVEIPQHFEELRDLVDSLSITIEKISDLSKICGALEGRKIDSWQIGVGKKKGRGHEQTMVLDFKIKKREIDNILHWLRTDRPFVTWGLWEKFGDPLIYWKSDDRGLYRYYWLGQKIGRLQKGEEKRLRN